MSIRRLTLVAVMMWAGAQAKGASETHSVEPTLIPDGRALALSEEQTSALASEERMPASTAGANAAEREFTTAMLRVRLHLPDLPDSEPLKALAIYDYLIAARLRRDLSVAAYADLDVKIDEFLSTRESQQVTRALRHAWLASLAQRGRWDWFLPRSSGQSDPQLICYRLTGLLAAGSVAVLGPEALARWSLPQKQPPQCSGAFSWLHQQGLITPALAESRTRAALAADNPRAAREFALDVPAPIATELLRWSDLLLAPKSAVNVLATHPDLPIDPDALAAGFDKLSRSDVAAANAFLPQLTARADSTPALQSRLSRSVALGLAYNRDSRALSAFAGLAPDAADSLVQEWRVRAALFAGDFERVRTWTEEMPPSMATLPRWRYWHARALAATAGEEAAAAPFAELADLRDYYGYLAADRLHRDYHLNAHPSPNDLSVQQSLASDPALIRARELFECGMSDDAAAEWGSVVNGTGSDRKIQAAHLAARWGWYAQSIATLAQSGDFDDLSLRYPRPYADGVEQASKISQLPGDWIFSVMRQESLFRSDAVSRADARGVMQMLPSTAVNVSRRWHMSPLSRDALFDPSIALPLGAEYLRELADKYAGNLALALAAYNAGPAAVERWIPPRTMEAAIWIENIPYNETRGYVQHIVEHIVAFAYVRGARPSQLTALMPDVQGGEAIKSAPP